MSNIQSFYAVLKHHYANINSYCVIWFLLIYLPDDIDSKHVYIFNKTNENKTSEYIQDLYYI